MKVQINILTNGYVRKELSLKLITWLRNTQHDVLIDFTEIKGIANCRNQIVQQFLLSDCEYLLMIDNDTIPQKNPLDLLDQNFDIVACPVPIYQQQLHWNVYNLDNEGYWVPINLNNCPEYLDADAVGTGCILIKREVLKKINAPFAREYNEKGIEILGLDLNFSKKIKNLGFNIKVACEYKCSHFKEINLLTNM